MTILANNIQRLTSQGQFSKAYIGRQCGVTPASVYLWMHPDNPVVPRPELLLILAGLFKTTIEELMTNPQCKSGEAVSKLLDFSVLNKVFTVLEKSNNLSYAYDNASLSKKSYIFGLLYSLCEETELTELSGDELLGMMDLSTGKKNDKKQKKRAVTSTKKRNTRRTTKRRKQ